MSDANLTSGIIYSRKLTAGDGDVVGGASSTEHAVARYADTSGKLIEDSGVLVSDTDDLTVPGSITQTTGNVIFNNGAGDSDFTVNKETSGSSIVYDAGADTLTLDSSSIYTTPLTVAQSSATGAVEPISLEQKDVDQSIMKIIGTSATTVLTNTLVLAADVSTATVAGYVKVNVQDDGDQITDQAYFIPVYTIE